MAIISNFIILSLCFCVVYFVGLLTFITDNEENKCDMTHMFEYPQFVKIMMPGDKNSRYGLYAYSEGKFTERARAMRFEGIPVLFVPGNAGSFKQIRSLASVALRKAINSRSRFHFNFFTVDLNNELSGLNGALLNDQTAFVNESVHRILSLYPNTRPNPPTSVILIGHSMGGVIAHGMMVKSGNSSVDLLITMGSPHRSPSISIDWYIMQYYDELQKNLERNKMTNKTVITVGAGNYDHLVNSWLTNANSSSINIVTTAIPGVWLSMDHACIVWCKQLVLTIIRALFHSIDTNTKQLSTDHSFRLAAFKYHLLHNSGINFLDAPKYRNVIRLDPKGSWNEDLRRQYTVSTAKGWNPLAYHMVRLLDDSKHQMLFIQAINLQSPDWIYACAAVYIQGQSRICNEAFHLSHRSEVAPSAVKFKKRQTFYFDLFRLKRRYPEITHVVVRLLPSAEPVTINFDVHNPSDRTVSVDLPNWFSLSRKAIITQTQPEALRYVIDLPGFIHVMQTYLLYLEPISCTTTSHQATAKLYLPWAHHDSQVFVTEGVKKPLVLRLHNSRPLPSNSTAKVILTLDPNCQYSVSIRNSIIGMLSQLARYYSPLLLANMTAIILMAYYSQMMHLEKDGKFLNFQTALSASIKPYYLITLAKLFTKTLSWGRFSLIFPMPDGTYLMNENFDFFILPLLMYMIAVGLVYLVSVALWSVMILSESTIHRIIAKCVTRTVGGAVKWSDWLLNGLHKVPCVLAITLFSLGLSTCGGIALCLGTIYYFLKLTQMCQEYIEGLVFRFMKKIMFKFIAIFHKKKKQNVNEDATMESATESTINENINNDEVVKGNENVEEKSENVEKQSDEEQNKGKTETEPQPGSSKSDGTENEDDKKIDEKGDAQESTNENEEETELRLRKLNKDEKENALEIKNETNENKDKEDEVKKKKILHDTIHFHFTLFLLWLIVTLINVPSVLTWARNYKYNNKLRPDPSGIPGIALSLCAIFLWQLELPKPNKLYYKEMAMFVYSMAVLCLIYTPLSIYRLPYFLAIVIIVTTIHQVFGPEHVDEAEESEESPLAEPDPVEHISNIRTKLE